MEFNHGWNNRHDSRVIHPQTSCHSHRHFAGQACQVCHGGSDFRRNQHELFHDHHQFPPPVHLHNNIHGGFLTEIGKERVTDDIIMAEIVRKQTLEAEVRMIENQLALLTRDQPFSFFPSPQMDHDLRTRLPLSVPEANWSSLEERLTTILEEIKSMNGRHEGRGYDPRPLPSRMEDMENQGTKRIDEQVKGKKKQIFLDNKDESITGSKKMYLARSDVGSNELPQTQTNNFTMSIGDKWSCALCKVIATSEQALKEHLREEKHKCMVESMRQENARKNGSIGLLPRKATKLTTIVKTVEPPEGQEAKLATEYFFCKETKKAYVRKQDLLLKAGNQTLQPKGNKGGNISGSKKTTSTPPQAGSTEIPKTDSLKKDNRGQWSCCLCEISHIGEKDLKAHLHGKRHKLKLDAMRLENARKNCWLTKKDSDTTTIIKSIDAEQDEIADTFGTRSVAFAAHEVVSDGFPESINSTRNDRDDRSCAIDQIGVSTKEVLNEDREHKGKFEALRSENGQKYCWVPKKDTKSTTIIENVVLHAEQEAKRTTECFLPAEPNNVGLTKQYSLLNAGDRSAPQPEAKKVNISRSWRMCFAAYGRRVLQLMRGIVKNFQTLTTCSPSKDSQPYAGDQALQPLVEKDNSLDQGGWLWRVLTNAQKLILKKFQDRR